MDLSELRDLLDYLENQGVDSQTLRRVFARYCPKPNEDRNHRADKQEVQRDGEEGAGLLVERTKLR